MINLCLYLDFCFLIHRHDWWSLVLLSDPQAWLVEPGPSTTVLLAKNCSIWGFLWARRRPTRTSSGQKWHLVEDTLCYVGQRMARGYRACWCSWGPWHSLGDVWTSFVFQSILRVLQNILPHFTSGKLRGKKKKISKPATTQWDCMSDIFNPGFQTSKPVSSVQLHLVSDSHILLSAS